MKETESIRVCGVKRGYPSGGGIFWALGGVDLEIEPGKLTILRGRSGSGKTTLVNIIGALDRPTEGSVWVGQRDITAMGDGERDALRRRSIGFVFQSVALVSMMNAYENVEFGLRVAGIPSSEFAGRTEECLRLVGLAQRSRHMPAELSGGEQQRVAIARAIAHRPSTIIADEPTAELDTRTGLMVGKIFRDLVELEGMTVVMSTHDTGLLELADKVYELEDGMLVGTRAGEEDAADDRV